MGKYHRVIVASIVMILLMGMLVVPQNDRVGGQSEGTVVRDLPTHATCGETVTVVLNVEPADGTTAWIIEESPPDEVTVDSNAYNEDTGLVKWVNLDGSPATVTYDIILGEGLTDGSQLPFSGGYRFDPGMDEQDAIAGDTQLTVSCPDGPGVSRLLSGTAECGQTYAVTLEVTVADDTTAWFVEEAPPEGVSVTNVGSGSNGEYVEETHNVKWLSLTGQDTVLTYTIWVPEGISNGTKLAFGGEYRFHPSMDERDVITGDNLLTVSCMGPPGEPTAVVAQAGPGKGEITLTWEPPIDGRGTVSSYHVYRDQSLVATTSGSTTHFTDEGLGNGKTHVYEITAENTAGEGPKSQWVSATTFSKPTHPLALTATTGPWVGEITLAWEPPMEDGGTPIIAYQIYQNGSLAQTVGAEEESLVVEDLAPGTSYDYVITAENLVGESGPSWPAEATTFDYPDAPRNLVAQPGQDVGQILLEWDHPEQDGGLPIEEYLIYRGPTPEEMELLDIVSSGTTEYQDGVYNTPDVGVEKLASNYHYGVAAVNPVGQGETSPTACSAPNPWPEALTPPGSEGC